MSKVVIYARYSTDLQRETSIEDQVRRCREVVARAGFDVAEIPVFEDQALSGTEKHLHKREGFRALIEAWDQGNVDVLVVDEVSRLGRDSVELAKLGKKIEETGVRLLTADGLDSGQQGWQLLFGMTSIVSQQSVRDTSHRVTRGMLGQLERGYMIATPPYGYDNAPCVDEKGYRVGTYWRINVEEAEVVKRIFTLRSQGAALGLIAKNLNQEGVSPNRKRKNASHYWRPGTIYKLLANTIYRGVFIWHSSPNVRSRARKRREPIGEREFLRPDLRIVDDELWQACNQSAISRTGYGGGTHGFSGLVSCGACGATLSVSTGGNSHALACASCAVARRVGADASGRGTLSVKGLKYALEDALKSLFTEPLVTELHVRLRKALNQGVDEELLAARNELDRLKRERERLSRRLRLIDEDDDFLIQEYRIARDAYLGQERKVSALKSRVARLDKRDVEKQLCVDPGELIHKLWTADIDPARLRAMLSGLFSEIVFEGRAGRHEAIVRITISPGEVAAVLSGTEAVDRHKVIWRYSIKTGPARPTKWVVERIPVPTGEEQLDSSPQLAAVG